MTQPKILTPQEAARCLIRAGCDDPRCFETHTDIVAFVGGCDDFGYCGIMTLGGYVGKSQHPVVGQQIFSRNT